jgi:hypothetical protein
MEFSVESSSRQSRQLVTAVLPNMLGQLKLLGGSHALLIKIIDDMPDQSEGVTMYVDEADCYLVLLRRAPRNNTRILTALLVTLAHELVHVKQMIRGTLKFVGDGDAMWRGKFYPAASTAYLDLPWELQAFAQQEIIARRAMSN